MKRSIITVLLAAAVLAFSQNFKQVSGIGTYKHAEDERPSYARDVATKNAFIYALEKFAAETSDPSAVENYREKIEKMAEEPSELFSSINLSKNEYNPQTQTYYVEFTANIDESRFRSLLGAAEENKQTETPAKTSLQPGQVPEQQATRTVRTVRPEDEHKKAGLNFVFDGGFNLMKSWEDHPTDKGIEEISTDEIPGAGLIGMRIEYDFGQFMNIPNTFIFAGSNYPITIIGKVGRYVDPSVPDSLLTWTHNDFSYNFTHTTFISEFGLSKKFFVVDDFAIVTSGSYVMHRMSLTKKSTLDNYNQNYKLNSSGYRGALGINFNMGKAWFFEMQISYTSMDPLKNDKKQNVFSEDDEYGILRDEFPYDQVEEDEFLIPKGLGIKIGLGLRL